MKAVCSNKLSICVVSPVNNTDTFSEFVCILNELFFLKHSVIVFTSSVTKPYGVKTILKIYTNVCEVNLLALKEGHTCNLY